VARTCGLGEVQVAGALSELRAQGFVEDGPRGWRLAGR
jgi:hypothetical protein